MKRIIIATLAVFVSVAAVWAAEEAAPDTLEMGVVDGELAYELTVMIQELDLNGEVLFFVQRDSVVLRHKVRVSPRLPLLEEEWLQKLHPNCYVGTLGLHTPIGFWDWEDKVWGFGFKYGYGPYVAVKYSRRNAFVDDGVLMTGVRTPYLEYGHTSAEATYWLRQTRPSMEEPMSSETFKGIGTRLFSWGGRVPVGTFEYDGTKHRIALGIPVVKLGVEFGYRYEVSVEEPFDSGERMNWEPVLYQSFQQTRKYRRDLFLAWDYKNSFVHMQGQQFLTRRNGNLDVLFLWETVRKNPFFTGLRIKWGEEEHLTVTPTMGVKIW